MLKLFYTTKSRLIVILTFFVLGVTTFVSNAYGATYRTGLDSLGSSLGLQPNISTFVGGIIIGILGFIGVVALILVIYAGFTWLMSQGDPTKITKAKNIMIWAVVGLVVIFASYAIVQFIIFNGFLPSAGTGQTTNSSGLIVDPSGYN
ncbi:MAG: hypothetical protein WC244_03575 [Patescibacteria group bacterium]|jgi:hypothetical protein